MSTEKQIRILYMEDNAAAARLFQKRLERHGYVVDLARNGAEGLTQFDNEKYDMVITDHDMPICSGLEVLRLLAEREINLPTIMVTGTGDERVAVEAMKLGASDYIVKDVEGVYLNLLPTVVEQVFRQKELLQQKLQAEAALDESLKQIERAKQEWEITVDSLPQVVCLLDKQGGLIRANLTLERWSQSPVTEVRGRSLHDLLHPNCTDPTCYLANLWSQAIAELGLGQSVEKEIFDTTLQRYLHLQIRPVVSTRENQLNYFQLDEAKANFAVVVQDITARKTAEEALRQSNAELQARNEDLDAFAHMAAHDLKGPLNVVIGYAELLLQVSKKEPATSTNLWQEGLSSINQTGHKMSNIIDELLLLAEIRKKEVKLKPLEMARVVEQARLRLTDIIKKYEAEIIVPTSWPIALSHAPWIEEIWANYISNAIKYGGQPPRVTVGGQSQADGLVRFWVQDNGTGLTPEELNQLFKPFVRLSQVRARGHGLGLSIVRRIVEKLGGQASVESAGVAGEGCIFSFTLPSET